ncbi:MAG: T9SS type A sorting domain-containing protein [Ignavibacteriaceae bacterium]
MKSIFTAISFFALVILFAVPSKTFAQTSDTVWVAATPVGNINDFISGDTTATGARVNPNRVYKLHRDSIFFFTGKINANFHLTLIAGNGNGALPVIEPAILPDNSRPSTFINLLSGGLTFKQLYLLGIAPDELPVGNGIAINIAGDSMKIKADSCIFDGWSNRAFSAGGKNNGYWITDNIFRNQQSYTAWLWGDAWISLSNIPTDTVHFANNTMFCNNSYALAFVYYNKYLVFNHNTVFLTNGNPLWLFNLTNGVITNNIFYGVEAAAEVNAELHSGRFDSDGQIVSVISFDTLTTVASNYGIKEAQRNIKVDNNAYFWPQSIKDFWKSINDTASSAHLLYTPEWMNSRTQNMFTNKTTWPNFEASNNVNVNPGFSASMEDRAISSFLHYVYLIRSNGLGSSLWWYNPTGSVYPLTQPVPENLAYSNTSLQSAGTDGFALGDLNWFPEQHNQWLVTDVKKEKGFAPTEYSLDQNYPNPFNPSTFISYSLQKEGNVSLKVFNILGQEVNTLVNKVQTAGSYKVSFNANSLSSGVYFYTLSTNGFMQIKKMMLLK